MTEIWAAAADGLDREHAGEDGAGDAAQPMHGEHVEGIVVAQLRLQPGGAPIVDQTGQDADGQRALGTDIAGRRICMDLGLWTLPPDRFTARQ